MPTIETTTIDVSDVVLNDPNQQPVPLATLTGVTVLVLMRHRH